MSWKGYVSDVYVDRYLSGAIDSGGLANDALGEVPDGFCWYVERLTCWSNASSLTNAVLELFVQRSANPPGATAQDKQGREDVIVGTDVKNHGRDYASPIYVPPGYYLVASWSGLTGNDLVTASTQIRVHRLEAPAMEHHAHQHGIDYDEMGEHVPHAVRVIPADEIAAV